MPNQQTAFLIREGGITQYTRLVPRCYEWAAQNNSHVCFVSFNYDMLLETALVNHCPFNPAMPESYFSCDYASVLKPHGSVNWAWRHLGVGKRNSIAYSEAATLGIDAGEPDDVMGELVMRQGLDNVIGEPGGSWVAYPAIALPTTDKAGCIWPEEQASFFDRFILRFDRVISIGWRAAEPHFTFLLAPLIRPDATVLIVTGGENAHDDSEEVASHFTLGPSGALYQYTNGFGALGDEKWEPLLRPIR